MNSLEPTLILHLVADFGRLCKWSKMLKASAPVSLGMRRISYSADELGVSHLVSQSLLTTT